MSLPREGIMEVLAASDLFGHSSGFRLFGHILTWRLPTYSGIVAQGSLVSLPREGANASDFSGDFQAALRQQVFKLKG